MAVDEVNEKLLGPMGHSLDFVVAETYGQEEVSIRQVVLNKLPNIYMSVYLYYFLCNIYTYFQSSLKIEFHPFSFNTFSPLFHSTFKVQNFQLKTLFFENYWLAWNDESTSQSVRTCYLLVQIIKINVVCLSSIIIY